MDYLDNLSIKITFQSSALIRCGLSKDQNNSQLFFFLKVLLGCSTIAPEENCPPDDCPPDNCLLDDCPLHNCSPGQLLPRIVAPEENCHPGNCPPDNCPRGELPRGEFPPPESCPLAMKFPPKIIAPTQAIPIKEHYELTENYALPTSTIIKESFY